MPACSRWLSAAKPPDRSEKRCRTPAGVPAGAPLTRHAPSPGRVGADSAAVARSVGPLATLRILRLGRRTLPPGRHRQPRASGYLPTDLTPADSAGIGVAMASTLAKRCSRAILDASEALLAASTHGPKPVDAFRNLRSYLSLDPTGSVCPPSPTFRCIRSGRPESKLLAVRCRARARYPRADGDCTGNPADLP